MNATVDGHGLPLRTRLAEFEIVGRLGEGGFSIVYLAWDHSLEREVALKEYMPSAVAARGDSSRVFPRSEQHRETFDIGLRSFINEGRLLAQFDHPALVKVFRAWEDNGTAYMVMPRYRGPTLKQWVQSLSQPPNEAWLLDLLGPLTAALRVIHAKSCFHRDIAPDNILVLEESKQPLLLDFGAARRVIGDMTHSPTAILKPGYAPVEQYAEIPGLKQGPWTDVYALGATVHWVITGSPPPASFGRTLHDSFVSLVQVAEGRYSLPFLQAIDRALAVLPEQRTKTIEDFCREVGIGQTDAATTHFGREVDPDATVIQAPPRPSPSVTHAPTVSDPGRMSMDAASLGSTLVQPSVRAFAPEMPDAATTVSRDAAARTRAWRSGWVWALVMALAAVAGVVAIYMGAFRNSAKPSDPLNPPASEVRPLPSPPPTATEQPQPPGPPAREPLAPAATEKPAIDAPAASRAESPSPSPAPPAQSDIPPRAAPRANARAPEPRLPSPPARGATAQVERRKPETADRAECTRLMTQLSLGDNDPALIERLRTLRCS